MTTLQLTDVEIELGPNDAFEVLSNVFGPTRTIVTMPTLELEVEGLASVEALEAANNEMREVLALVWSHSKDLLDGWRNAVRGLELDAEIAKAQADAAEAEYEQLADSTGETIAALNQRVNELERELERELDKLKPLFQDWTFRVNTHGISKEALDMICGLPADDGAGVTFDGMGAVVKRPW